jgi:hypothetical protein
MSSENHIIDYDKIEEWSPWLNEIMTSIGPRGFIDALRRATPEYLGDGPRDRIWRKSGAPCR